MANVRSLLDEHEAATLNRIEKLRAELVPLERELLEIRLAKSALERSPANLNQPELFSISGSDPRMDSGGTGRLRNLILHRTFALPPSPYARFTIKELVLKALDEQFEDGATAAQLLDLFANAWGRQDIVRTSLSPQLSRLKQEGQLVLDGQIWRIRRPHQLENETAADP